MKLSDLMTLEQIAIEAGIKPASLAARKCRGQFIEPFGRIGTTDFYAVTPARRWLAEYKATRRKQTA
jgi:hypothetical protein